VRALACALLALCSCADAPEDGPRPITPPGPTLFSEIRVPIEGNDLNALIKALDAEVARAASGEGVRLVRGPHGAFVRVRKGGTADEWLFGVRAGGECGFRMIRQGSDWEFRFETGNAGLLVSRRFDAGMRDVAEQTVLRLKHGDPPR
jgi:hypothetical protein